MHVPGIGDWYGNTYVLRIARGKEGEYSGVDHREQMVPTVGDYGSGRDTHFVAKALLPAQKNLLGSYHVHSDKTQPDANERLVR